jgi:hypothetical protein
VVLGPNTLKLPAERRVRGYKPACEWQIIKKKKKSQEENAQQDEKTDFFLNPVNFIRGSGPAPGLSPKLDKRIQCLL